MVLEVAIGIGANTLPRQDISTRRFYNIAVGGCYDNMAECRGDKTDSSR